MASSAEEIRKHLKTYYIVFGSLAVLTVVTVAVAFLELLLAMAIAVAMLIALVKGNWTKRASPQRPPPVADGTAVR